MEAKYEIYIPADDDKIWYYDHTRNAIGHIKNEDEAVKIAEDESLGLIVFYATVAEIQMTVALPEPEIDRNEISFKTETGWSAMSSSTIYGIPQPRREPLPDNYTELYASKVYCMYREDWISDTNEWIAQRDADDRDGFIYFFYDEDLVPEEYDELRELVRDAMDLVDGCDRELPTELELDQHTLKIIDWVEKNAHNIP